MNTVIPEAFLAEKDWTGAVILEIAPGVTVELTHLDKVYWPDEGLTKSDLLRYYLEIGGYILPYLADRPVILKRYPNGIRPLPAKTGKHDRGTGYRTANLTRVTWIGCKMRGAKPWPPLIPYELNRARRSVCLWNGPR